MIYEVSHTTTYDYSESAALCHTEIRLAPRSFAGQRLLKFHLEIQPEPEVESTRHDYFGNEVTVFSLREPHSTLVVQARSRVEVSPRPEMAFEMSPPWEQVARHLASYPDDESLEALQYTYESPFVEPSRELADYARRAFTPGAPVLKAAHLLCRQIHKEFKYKPQSTKIDTPLVEVFARRQGVCQDFSHLMVGCLRSLKLPARYVSGYLRSSPDVVGAEASHAWASVFVPGMGWFDFDPTNDAMPSEGHVTVAWGRDYSDVTPVKGVTLGGGEHTVTVAVRVDPANEST